MDACMDHVVVSRRILPNPGTQARLLAERETPTRDSKTAAYEISILRIKSETRNIPESELREPPGPETCRPKAFT